MMALLASGNVDPGSFRDPSGFVFWKDELPYRYIDKSYIDNYKLLMDSGLYRSLSAKGYLIEHEEEVSELPEEGGAVIRPRKIPFISYPYEWSFGQLRDAAILTLEVQLEALRKGMTLKDASAYNIQFDLGRPVFIDTLSFEKYQEGKPWQAYRQFCQHFLSPLAVMAYRDIRLGKLMASYIDGIPLDLASSLLPARTWLKFGLFVHLHLHARQQNKMADKPLDAKKLQGSFSRQAMVALLDSLLGTVKGLEWKPGKTEWDDYYQCNNNYSSSSFTHKEELIKTYLGKTGGVVWDMGANDGHFSRVAEGYAERVVSWDVDQVCVERNYLIEKKREESKILPLFLDITNPSPGIGWKNQERGSFSDRASCDTLMALGLIHHLVIGNNLPLRSVLETWSRQCRFLVLEFVPKTDSQVVKLLKSREDIWPSYHQEGFEQALKGVFDILEVTRVKDSERFLYLCRSVQK